MVQDGHDMTMTRQELLKFNSLSLATDYRDSLFLIYFFLGDDDEDDEMRKEMKMKTTIRFHMS